MAERLGRGRRPPEGDEASHAAEGGGERTDGLEKAVGAGDTNVGGACLEQGEDGGGREPVDDARG